MNHEDKQQPDRQESPTEDLQVNEEQTENVTGGARSNHASISYTGLE